MNIIRQTLLLALALLMSVGAWAQTPQKYASVAVDITTLHANDTLMEGVSITSAVDVKFTLAAERYSIMDMRWAVTYERWPSMPVAVGDDGLISLGGNDVSPYTDQYTYGNAWVVDSVMPKGNYYYLYLSGVTATLPITDVPRLQDDGSWIFAMPGADRAVDVQYKSEGALAWSPAVLSGVNGYIGFAGATSFPTLDNPNSLTGVRFGSSSTDVATIDPSTGAITFVAAGSTTIYAVFDGNDDFLYDSIYYTLNVLTPPTMTIASMGNGTVDITGKTQSDVREESFATNQKIKTYVGEKITLTHNSNNSFDWGDKDGFFLQGDARVTISAPRGTVITEMHLTVGYYFSNAQNFYSSEGSVTATSGNANITVTDVNASSLTIGANSPLQIKNVTVYYIETYLPEGVAFGAADNIYNVFPGTKAVVKATPDEHNHLDSWSNAAEINLTLTDTVTVASDTTITATFAKNAPQLAWTYRGGNVLPVGGVSAYFGFTADTLNLFGWTANDEFLQLYQSNNSVIRFGSTDDGVITRGSNGWQVVAPGTCRIYAVHDGSIMAYDSVVLDVTILPSYTMHLATNNILWGSVSSVSNADSVTHYLTDNQYLVVPGATAVVKATAPYSNFASWSNGAAINETLTDTIVVTSDTTITANFTQIDPELAWTYRGSAMPAGGIISHLGFEADTFALVSYTSSDVFAALVANTPSAARIGSTDNSVVTFGDHGPVAVGPGTCYIYIVHDGTIMTYDSVAYKVTILPSHIVTLAANGNGNVSLGGIVMSPTDSENMNTNTRSSTYTGSHFTVSCQDVGSGDGFFVSTFSSATISALNNGTILAAELFVGGYEEYAGHLISTAGDVDATNGNTHIVIENINASSFTIRCDDDYLLINRVMVFYSEPTLPDGVAYTSTDNVFYVIPDTTVVVNATPATHSHFVSWSNGAALNENFSNTIVVSSDTAITATFELNDPELAWQYRGSAMPAEGITAYYGFTSDTMALVNYGSNDEFATALANEHASLRFGSTDASVVSFTDPTDLATIQFNAAGTAVVYMVHDGTTMAHDSVAFPINILQPNILTLSTIGSGSVAPVMAPSPIVTWNTETWADFESTSDESEFTANGITFNAVGTAYLSSENLFFFISKYNDSKTLTFSTTGAPFYRIEMTLTSPVGQYNPDINPTTGWTADGNTAVWVGEPTTSLTLTSCTTTVSQIVFYRVPTPDSVKASATDGQYLVVPGATVAVVATPAQYNHLASWSDDAEVNEDLTDTIVVSADMSLTATFDKNAPNLAWTYNRGSILMPAEGVSAYHHFTDDTMDLISWRATSEFNNLYRSDPSVLRLGSTDNNVVSIGAYGPEVVGAGECDVYAVHDGSIMAYDSVAFHVAILAPDTLILSANDDNMGSVQLLGTVTTATLRTGAVNVDALQVGDVLTGVSSISGLSHLSLEANRYKEDGATYDYSSSLSISQITSFDGSVITTTWPHTYTPVDEQGNDANAWVVLEIDANGPVVGGRTVDVSQPIYNVSTTGIYDNGGNTYFLIPGTEVSALATANDRYHLASWSNGDAVSDILADTATLTVNSDITLTSNFEANPVLTLAANDGGTLELDGVTPGATTYDITIEGDNTYTNVTFPFQTTVFLHEGIDDVWVEDQSPLSVEKDGNNAVITISGPYGGGTVFYSYGPGAAGHKSIFCTAVEGAPTTPQGVTYAGYNTYLVLPGTQLSVTATPDSAHYLSAIDGHDTVSNSACGYSFVMPSNDYPLNATFTTKPTLTLAQADGGTLEAIVPQGGALTSEFSVPGEWAGNGTLVKATANLPGDFQPVGESVALAWQNTTGQKVLLFFGGDEYSAKYIKFQADGSNSGINDDGITKKSVVDLVADEGYLVRYTTGTGTPNVTRIGTTNTYYIDYNTDVTVVATPDSAHYLKNFVGDADTNSNVAVEKTYGPLTAALTVTANFAAKPQLILAHTDGGTLTLDGYSPDATTYDITIEGGNTYTNVTFPFQTTVFLHEGLQDVGSGQYPLSAVRDGNSAAITISEPYSGDRSVSYTYIDNENFISGNKRISCQSVESAPTMPAGVVSANATLDTFVVDYGAEITVVATPAEHYHLQGWSNNVTDNGDSTATLTLTQDETVSATFAQNAPELAWEYDDETLANGDIISAYHGFEMDSIAKLTYSANDEFFNAYMNTLQNTGTSLLRFGSSDTNVVSFADAFDPQSLSVNAPGTATLYMVHDGSLMAYDSAYITFTLLAPDTLTLAHNDGGNMTVEIGGNAVWNSETWADWTEWNVHQHTVDGITIDATGYAGDYNEGGMGKLYLSAFHSGDSIIFSSANGNFTRIEMTFVDDQNKTVNGEGWGAEGNMAVWTGSAREVVIPNCTTLVGQITFFRSGSGNSADSLRAISENTYAAVPGATATVTATPDSVHYLLNFDNDAAINSNDAAEKTYTVNGNTTATATFTHKPLLTLNQTEGGELNIEGRSARVSELTGEMKSGWNDDNTLVTPADLPGFQAVDADLAATWTGASPSGYTYLICELTQDDLVRYVVFYDGSYSTDFLSDGRKNGVNMMTMGNHAYYTTGITFPQGILATETPNAYAVDYDSTVVVVAKPDQHYHLTSWSNNYIINATLTDTLRVNNNATLTASFEKNSPELAWTYHGIPVANGTAISAYHGFEADTIDYIDTLVNEEFTYARYKEDASLRYGSTNPAVVSYDENGNYTINGAGTTTLYMVHDGSLMAYDSAYITFTLLAPDTLTLVNNEGGNMTVEIGGGNAVWNSETWADWTDWNVKQHTVDGITIDATGYAGDYNEGGRGKLFLSAFDSGDSIIFSSANGNFTRIEMTFVDDQNKTVNGEGWGAEGNMAVWTGSAREVVIPNCTTLVGQITFFRSGSGNSADSLRAISENTYAAVPGATATVTATPDSVHYLVRFDNDDAINSNIAATKTYTVSGNTTATANFTDKPVLTITRNQAAWGSVKLQLPEVHDDIVVLTDSTYRVDYGTTVAVFAQATTLHHVAGWQDEDSTAMSEAIYAEYFVPEPANLFPAVSTLTFTVTADTTAVALFGINSYDATATATLDDRFEGTPRLMGTVAASYFDIEGIEHSIAPDTNLSLTAQGGATTTLVAVANYGYLFKHWTVGNGIVLTDTLRITEAYDVTAVFVPDTFTVALNANDSDMGSLVIDNAATALPEGVIFNADGTYGVAYLVSINTKAVPANRCFDFSEWSNGVAFDESAMQTVKVEGDTSLTATFVRHMYTGDTTASECDKFAWHDNSYTLTPAEAPTYLYTTPDECDSTVTLHLTIRHSNTGIETATACDQYTWQGTTYTESNTIDQRILTNIDDCDSVVTLNLTVNYHHDTAYNDQADVRYEWLGEVFTENGVYVRTIETYQGCDSTITLTLAIAPYETPIPDIYHLMGAMLMINHFPEGFDSVGYIYYRWYRDGELVKEGLDADSYDEGGVLLDGCYYLEISTDANHKYWAKSNELCFNKGVGIADVETVSLAIAPNPVAKGSRVSVIVSGAADLQGAILTIYDAQGRQVMNTEMTNSNFEIQNTQFASGIYTVRVALRDGRIATKRLVVR